MANASGSVATAVVSGASSGTASIPPSSVASQTPSDAAGDNTPSRSPNPQTQQQEEPEWEFSNGKRYKRSDAERRIKDFEKGFYRTAEKNAQLTKQYGALSEALQRYGITPEQFLADPDAHMSRAAQEIVARQVDESMIDPREREYTRRQRELDAREEKLKKHEQTRAEQEKAARVEGHVNKIAEEMVPAFEQAGLPVSAKTVARAAEVMRAALKKGIKLSAAEAAEYAAEQIKQEQEWYRTQNKFDPSKLSKDELEAVRKHLLSQVKNPAPPRQPQAVAQPRDAHNGKYIGWGDYAKTRRI